MTEPRVWDIKDPECPEDAVYIGRGTPYGNPFVIGFAGNREDVIQQYRRLIESDPQMVAYVRTNLKGRDLKCHCYPLACHGDVLLELANS